MTTASRYKHLRWCRLLASLYLFAAVAPAQESHPPEVGVVSMGAGSLYTDRDGYTLYTYKPDQQTPGSSACVEECSEDWPPLSAPADASPAGDWSVIQRPDTDNWTLAPPAEASYQWAYRNRPVYRYVKDEHPGAIIGEKASIQWDVLFEPIAMPAGVAIRATEDGQVLVDVEGRTIYANHAERCAESCMEGWHAVRAPWLAGPVGADWAITVDDDATKQWIFRGQRLYIHPGQGTDNRRDSPVRMQWESQGWQPVVVQAAPAVPDWVTFQETDLGPVLATASRMTIYYVGGSMAEIHRTTCDAQCVQDNWDPVPAGSGARPVANWSTVTLEDGSMQWTYFGRPVFTYRHDNAPGDTKGDKFGSGANIRGGWQAILKETLVQKLF